MPAFGPDAENWFRRSRRPTANWSPTPTRRCRRPTTRRSARCTAPAGRVPGVRVCVVPRLERQAARPGRPGRHRPGPDPHRRPRPPRLVRPLRREPAAGTTPARRCRRSSRTASRRPSPPCSTAMRHSRRTPSGRTSPCGRTPRSPKPPPPVPIAPPGRRGGRSSPRFRSACPTARWSRASASCPPTHDLLVYDLGDGRPHTLFTGGQILRNVQGRIRQFLAAGTADRPGRIARPATRRATGSPRPVERTLLGYDRLPDGARVRGSASAPGPRRRRQSHPPTDRGVTFAVFARDAGRIRLEVRPAALTSAADRTARPRVTSSSTCPPRRPPPAWDGSRCASPTPVEGSLERPGYKADRVPAAEDRLRRGPRHAGGGRRRPKDGRVFVASMKTGELFVLRDPTGDGKNGPVRELRPRAVPGRLLDAGGGRRPVRPAPPQPDADRRDARRRRRRPLRPRRRPAARRRRHLRLRPTAWSATSTARFVFSYAPYANATMPGSGGALRLTPGQAGRGDRLRDAQPARLVQPGRTARSSSPTTRANGSRPTSSATSTRAVLRLPEPGAEAARRRSRSARPAVWVPYGWARSINGVAYDNTGGKFGPFAGQFFLAELMFGGAIIRANVEKVNGVYQGACFPFWGKGLLGPVTLAFDPGASSTSAASPSRAGWPSPTAAPCSASTSPAKMPFEMQSIHVRPRGFRLVFTRRWTGDGRRSGVVPARTLPLRVHRRLRLAGAGPHAGEDREGRRVAPTGVAWS